MEILNIIGLSISFAGSVMLAAGAIKSITQAEKESRTYYRANPFVSESLLFQRKLALPGVILLFIGFALQIGASVSIGAKAEVYGPIMLGLTLVMTGLFAIVLMVLLLGKSDKKRNDKIGLKQLKSRIHTYLNGIGAIKVRSKEDVIKWANDRAFQLMQTKGDVPHDLWKDVYEFLIVPLKSSTEPEAIEKLFRDYLDINLGKRGNWG